MNRDQTLNEGQVNLYPSYGRARGEASAPEVAPCSPKRRGLTCPSRFLGNEGKVQQENCAAISRCGSQLTLSPTDKWWIKKNAHEGLCYDCIVNSMRNVICGLDADKSPNARHHARSEAEEL